MTTTEAADFVSSLRRVVTQLQVRTVIAWDWTVFGGEGSYFSADQPRAHRRHCY